MCMMSVVMDHYKPYFPSPNLPWQPRIPSQPLPAPRPVISPEDMRRLIEAFKAATASAEVFDEVTGQPDCVDPAKAELIERVAELEARLDAIREAAGA